MNFPFRNSSLVKQFATGRLVVLILFLCLLLATMMVRQTAAMPQANVVGIGGSACGYATISEAILAATSGDAIYLSPGTYHEVLGTIDKDLHFTAATADCTTATPEDTAWNYVVDGGGAVAAQGGVVNIAAGRTVTFTTVTLQNAAATRGGIVYVDEGATATFNKVRLLDGTAAEQGGILYVAANASLFINDISYIQGGNAGNEGGGLYLAGYAEFFSGVRIQDSHAAAGGGAAMVGDSRLILWSSSIGEGLAPNSAGTGGGIHMTGQSRLEMHSVSTIRWNNATADHGGGIYTDGNVSVEMYGGRIYGNQAIGNGGGIYAVNGASITLTGYGRIGDDNPAYGNQADYGGGIYADGAAAVNISEEAIVLHNSATSAGGGIYLDGGTPLNMEGGHLLGNQTDAWGGGLAINDGTATLQGTVIARNLAQQGGGISLENSSANELVAINTQIISNTATLDGGGVYSQLADVTFLDTDGTSRLAGNTASRHGGALATTGALDAGLGALELGSELRIEGNTAGGHGGALYHETPDIVAVFGNVWLANNEALADGGGWYQDGGRVLLLGLAAGNRPQIVGNKALNGRGGGLYLSDISGAPGDADSILLNPIIAGNQADAEGGGLYVNNGSFIQLINALVHDNQAGIAGGGLFLAAAQVEVRQESMYCQNTTLPANSYCSEFRNNSAPISGGAVQLQSSAEFSLQSTAVLSNTAPIGSGVGSASNGDHIEITNSLFTHNSGKAIYLAQDGFMDLVQTTLAANEWAIDIDGNGAVADLQNNIIWGNGTGVESEVGLAGGCSISQNGVGGLVSDPLFQSTGRGDYRLQPGSPAVDVCGIGTDVDLDGAPRPAGGNFDMGAFEAGLPLLLFPAQDTILEGDTGITSPTFAIALSEPSTQTVSVAVTAVGLSAVEGEDFQPLAQTITFPAGSISQTVPLEIMGDQVFEVDEQLALQWSAASGAHLLAMTTTITIANDDPLPELSIAPAEILEGDSGTSPVYVEVSLSNPSAFTVTVNYGTDDDGTATAGVDYEETSGTLTIPPGEETVGIMVLINGDKIPEEDEDFIVYLSNPAGATLPGEYSPAGYGWFVWVTILNDDHGWQTFLPVMIKP